MFLRSLFICCLLVLASGALHADPPAKLFAYGYNYTIISAGWGVSYRTGEEVYQRFTVSKANFRHSCTQQSFKAYGAGVTLFGNNDFSGDLFYCRSIYRFSGHMLIPYWKISPVAFRFESTYGMNIKPGVGFRFSPFYHCGIGVELDASYGYDIPVISERAFTAGRHDFSVVAGLTINIYDISMWRKRNAEQELGGSSNPVQ